jgi:hypothetical protein
LTGDDTRKGEYLPGRKSMGGGWYDWPQVGGEKQTGRPG